MRSLEVVILPPFFYLQTHIIDGSEDSCVNLIFHIVTLIVEGYIRVVLWR